MDEVNREEVTQLFGGDVTFNRILQEKLIAVERFFNEKVDKAKETDREIENLLMDIKELEKEVSVAKSARSASPYAPLQTLIIVVCVIIIVLVLLEVALHSLGYSEALYERLGFPHHAGSHIPPFLARLSERGGQPS